MESFGKYLKEERETRGYSIENVSQATKISPGQIRALESDDFSYLPPITFVKGFVRSYAKHIGLDSDEAVTRLEEYLSEIEENEQDYFIDEKQPRFRRAGPDPRLLVGAAAIFLVLVILSIILAVRGCANHEEARMRTTPPASESATVSTQHENAPGSFNSSPEEVVEASLPAIPREYFQVSHQDSPYSAPERKTSDDTPGIMGSGSASAN